MTEIKPISFSASLFLDANLYIRTANNGPLMTTGSDKSGTSSGHSVLACECLEGLHTEKDTFMDIWLQAMKIFPRLSIIAPGIQV